MVDERKFLEDDFKGRSNRSTQQFRTEAYARCSEGHVGSYLSPLTTETRLQARVTQIYAEK